MAHIPLFQNPFGFSMMPSGVSISTPVSIPISAPVQFVGGVPLIAATIQPVVQSVGCVILTRRGSNYDFILAHSERNAFEAFGGSIQYGTDPRDCMNSLLRNIGLRVPSNTPYIDMTNPADGKLTRVYVLYVDSISCRALTQMIQMNPVISGAFHHFTRFPVQNVIRSPHNLLDDKGFSQIATTFAQNILRRIASNYLRYI